MSDSKLLVGLIIIALIIAVIWALNKNNNRLIPNDGTIIDIPDIKQQMKAIDNGSKILNNNRQLNEYVVNDIVDEIISQTEASQYSPTSSISDKYGSFDNYEHKKHLNTTNTEYPYSDENDDRNFVYKKKNFTKRTHEDIQDLFDVDKMLPQEMEQGWFDPVPLQHTKKIKGTQFVHPKEHMGINTVGSSRKNGTHDIRGDIPNPQIKVSPWNNSTIVPDPYARGLC